MSICLVGNGVATSRLLLNSNLAINEVVYVDKPHQSLVDACARTGIPLTSFPNLVVNNYKLIIMYECPLLIKQHQLLQTKWVNIHFGVLPKWRGHSANSWALLNDEEQLGWTIHEVTSEFDAGPIIKLGYVKNDFESSYFSLKLILQEKLEIELSGLIESYMSGNLKLLSNDGTSYYCAKLLKSDGEITSFNISSKYLFNLSRLYITPSSSDLVLVCCGVRHEIKSMALYGSNYIGPPGKILKKQGSSFLIKTSDGSIWVEFYDSVKFLNHRREGHS